MNYISVFSTCKDHAEARLIANKLLAKKLAACVQLEKIESFYTWQDKIENEKEIRLVIKTRLDLYEKVARLILKENFYEVPEIIVHEIKTGFADYLRWMDSVL